MIGFDFDALFWATDITTLIFGVLESVNILFDTYP